jgi:ribonuclease D
VTAASGVPAYLESDDAVAAFFAKLGKPARIAVDTEGASFHRFVDRIYLIQLSTDAAHAIIDPLPIAAPAALGALIESPQVEVVFHDADYDLRLLHQDYGWQAKRVFDTRVAAQLLGITSFGLAALLESHFGVKLDKKHQRADWSMRPLTDGMLEYAAQDTLHLLGLRDRLADALEKKQRWAWAEEEFARLDGLRWDPEEPGTAFLKVKGARDLSRRELALLRELVTWRDGLALQLDKATFRVVGNEALIEAAKLAPRDKDALGKIKGMPRGIVERHGADVLAAIARGVEVPESALPKFPKGKRWARDPDFDAKVGQLKSVRDEAAKRLELDPGVLCSRDRMEAVARIVPRTMDDYASIPEMRRWQVAELGAGFITALKGYTPVAANTPRQGAGSEDSDSPYRDA